MSGQFTKLTDDNCAVQLRTNRSRGPYEYQMYRGAYVNSARCHVDQKKYVSLVDIESELKGRSRSASDCNQFQYNANSKLNPRGTIGTFSPLVPVSLPPQVCPDAEKYLYFNNGLLRPTNVGQRFPNPNICANVKPERFVKNVVLVKGRQVM
jgi:hypothetical protein